MGQNLQIFFSSSERVALVLKVASNIIVIIIVNNIDISKILLYFLLGVILLVALGCLQHSFRACSVQLSKQSQLFIYTFKQQISNMWVCE